MINIFLILPALILVTIVFLIPMIRYGWISFHSFSVSTNLELVPNNYSNWERLFSDERFWKDLFQTIRFAISSVSIEVILAIIIALILNQSMRSRGAIRSISLLPWALPTTVMALGWRWIFNSPYGPIEQFLRVLNLNSINILSSPKITWIATVVADVWKTTPFVAIILLAGLQTIPENLYEVFKLEGGKEIQSFFKITLPLLYPYLTLAIIFRLAQAFGVFDLIQIFSGGGPAGSTESIALYAYLNAMRFLDFGYSSTIMIASFIILIIATFLVLFIANRIRSFNLRTRIQ
tara:strand:+ start:1596 stop:2471 length:876 start_codon:yes stop_codon:yes gene_type:complete